MPNTENIRKAIAIMKRAGKVDMSVFQESALTHLRATEEELHACGTAACFAGWVAVSPEWREAGGRVGEAGQPILEHYTESDAIGVWLGIPWSVSFGLVFSAAFYNCSDLAYVTREDVIAALEALL